MPQALLWETLRHGRWSLPGCFLLGNLLPLFIYGALSGFPFNARDREFVVLQFAFLPIIVLQFAGGIIVAQGPMSRLYSAPISTPSIVAWHTLSGAAILVAETIAAAWLYNSLFHVGWPIFGPALFAATFWSAFQILLSGSNQRSLLSVFLAGLPVAIVCLWLGSRYGSFISPPKYYWTKVSIADFVTLASLFLSFYALTTYCVSKARCGERIPTLGVLNWMSRNWDAIALRNARPRRFRSSAHAQFWYEWRMKGIVMPILMAFLLVLVTIAGLVEWIAGRFTSDGFYEIVRMLGALLPLLALGGGLRFGFDLLGSQAGQREKQFVDVIAEIQIDALDSFQSSLPMTTFARASAIMTTIALSCLAALCLWFAYYLVFLALLWINNCLPNSILPIKNGSLYFLLTIIGPWTVAANTAVIGLSGRAAKILFSIIGLLAGVVVLLVLKLAFLPDFSSLYLYRGCLWCGAVLTVMATIWAFERARRHGFLTFRSLQYAALASCGAMVLSMLITSVRESVDAYPLVLVAALLTVLPFASIPLSIAWNRHR